MSNILCNLAAQLNYMEKFVDKIAAYIKNASIQLEDWVIILPSERAKQYVQQAIYEVYQQPIFSPTILTINQWVKQHTHPTILNKTRLLLHLFEVHTKQGKEAIDAVFDEFMTWGNIVLSDFDEMERYLIDSTYLFRNLKDIKEIENWSFGEGMQLSERQKRFMEFWDRLPAYYQEFNALLASKNATYGGKSYRDLSENIDRVFANNANAHFLFCGFNAMSLAEKQIIKQLQQLGRGHFLVDADAYYFEDKQHEAGAFIRSVTNYLGIKNPSFISNTIGSHEKKIELISCSQSTGQVKAIGSLLASFSSEKIAKSLVLLADESLIVPLINSIPANVGEANITLGLPLKNSSVRTWVDLLFKIQEGIVKHQRVVIYHKDLLAFWNHPFIIALVSKEEEKLMHAKEQNMRKFNTIFQQVDKVQISPRLDNLLALLYVPWGNDWGKAMTIIRKFNETLFGLLEDTYLYEKTLLHGFDQAIVDFQNCISENFPKMSIHTFKNLFNQEWTRDAMAFYGNPIGGLQIMGLLETRLLDFETILVVGMNEGKMPPTNPIQTLIPMDLRQHVGLPLPRDKQGLFAHHFYRLLHVCSEMYITYSSSMEGVNSNEPSRYLLQLELELTKFSSNIHFTKKYYTLESNQQITKIKSIDKTNDLVLRLDQLLRSGISASALKTYFTCPLDFYYKYVLRFGEEEKVEESIESNQLGTFVHAVLEELYLPYSLKDKQGIEKSKIPPKILVEDIDQMIKAYPLEMRKQFSAHFNGDPEAYSKGKNYLSFTMALELTKRFFEFERKRILALHNTGIRIVALEEKLEEKIIVQVYGKPKEITLKGVIDRVDEMNDEIYIWDYKTGKVDSKDVGKELKMSEDKLVYLVNASKDSKHFFQLMLYCFLYFKRFQRIPKSSAIISLVNIKNSPFILYSQSVSIAEMIELFPEVLSKILEEIYDENQAFTHAEQFINYCNYCV